MLWARELSHAFGAIRALDGISFTLDRGQTLVIFGPNGAGKTTLLRVLAGLVRPSRGSAGVEGGRLANPAPSWQGVGDWLDLGEWSRYVPWAVLHIPADQGEQDVTDASRDYVMSVAENEILSNIEKALTTELSPEAREALEAGAKPAAETLARGEF